MGFIQEFKAFAMKGNVIDLAVGVVIGGAFGKIVSSVVADLIMPPIGLILGGVNFTDLKFILKEAVPAQMDSAGAVVAEAIPAVSINYGNFIQSMVDFTIIAFAIFILIKLINAAHKKQEQTPPAPPAPTEDQKLLTEIRDILKNK